MKLWFVCFLTTIEFPAALSISLCVFRMLGRCCCWVFHKKTPPFPGIVCKNRLPFNLFWKHIFILIFLLHVLILLPTFCFANLNFKEWEIETVKSLGEIYWPNATLYHGYIYFVDSVNAWSTFYVNSWLFNCR